MEKINIGLVGAGRIAGHHIRSIRKLKKLKIVSICDLDIDKAKFYGDKYKINIYSHYGYNDFVLALGYKANYIKDYFLNFRNRNSNITIELKSGNLSFSNTMVPNWNISMIDTGINSMKKIPRIRLALHQTTHRKKRIIKMLRRL